MKRYAFEKQDGIKDCGVACLKMIIRYHKGYVGTELLRDMTKTDKNGVTAFHLVNTLNKLGFKSRGLKVSIDNIKTLPAIAHVTIDNTYNHYVVIYNINKQKEEILIADPAKRIMKMSFQKFNEIYNNIIIEAIPYKKIPVIKDYSISKFILNLIKNEKKIICIILIMSLITTVLSIISSFYVQLLLNNLNRKIIILFFFMSILLLILEYIKNNILIKLDSKLDRKLTMSTYQNIINLPYQYFKNRTTGEIITRLNDLKSVKNTINRVIITIFIDGILVFLSSIILIKINVVLFLIAVTILIMYILITIIFNNKFKYEINDIKEKNEYLNSNLIESIDGIETIKGLNLQPEFLNKVEKIYTDYMKESITLDKKINIQFTLKEMVNTIGNMIILCVGVWFIQKKIMDFGSLFTFLTLVAYFLNPIRNIIDLNIDITESISAIKRILELDYYQNDPGKINIDEINNIEIKKLSYSYNDYNYILKDINLKISKGEHIMVVGTSGSGKSSLLKIINNYYETKKQVYINDNEINQLKNIPINYISQNEILFTDTLFNNLKLNRQIDKNTIEKIYKEYEIDKIIPLNGLIEENGFNISGGEKQRIVLARTLLNQPKFLIIDEALNQVDINMERKILKQILKIKNLTLIYVSHRNNNVDLFDRVIKIEDGFLKEDIRKE